jgi:hypothetical protein
MNEEKIDRSLNQEFSKSLENPVGPRIRRKGRAAEKGLRNVNGFSSNLKRMLMNGPVDDALQEFLIRSPFGEQAKDEISHQSARSLSRSN